MKPIILSLESATPVCSVALSKGNKLLCLKETTEGNRHSEWMTLYIEHCMQEANMRYSDIDAIAVSKGPGSYTGLRVGYSIAKGLAYQLDIPIIEVNTIRSIAFGLKNGAIENSDLIIPMIDARRMEVYQQFLDYEKNPLSEIYPCILDEYDWTELSLYNKVHIIGNGAFKFKKLDCIFENQEQVVIYDEIINSAQNLIPEALEKWTSKEFADVAYCVPFYLKSPNITKSKKPLF